MDPNANLKEQRSIASEIKEIWDRCTEAGELTESQEDRILELSDRFAELVTALDGWITNGGFLPATWQAGRVQA